MANALITKPISLPRENSCFNPFSRDSCELRVVSHARNPFTPTPAQSCLPILVDALFPALYSSGRFHGRSWFKVDQLPGNQPFTLNRNAYLDLIARAPSPCEGESHGPLAIRLLHFPPTEHTIYTISRACRALQLGD